MPKEIDTNADTYSTLFGLSPQHQIARDLMMLTLVAKFAVHHCGLDAVLIATVWLILLMLFGK